MLAAASHSVSRTNRWRLRALWRQSIWLALSPSRKRPVLPEGVALADAATAVHALDDGRGDAIGGHHQGGQRAGKFERPMKG